ncbi:MAG: Lrp/AsnC ligand binding domain-containing protein [Candidatus Thermoplasmatota archaeon]|nr:Lrp/AsnC ligand binding domain-containing protein [Candidatus Thermoplasmatota archaeon]
MASVRKTKGYKKQISTEAVDLEEQAQTRALVMIKVASGMGDKVATELVKFERVDDVYAITGDSDLAIKVNFGSPKDLKQFLMKDVSSIDGIENTKTFLIMDAYKDAGLTI